MGALSSSNGRPGPATLLCSCLVRALPRLAQYCGLNSIDGPRVPAGGLSNQLRRSYGQIAALGRQDFQRGAPKPLVVLSSHCWPLSIDRGIVPPQTHGRPEAASCPKHTRVKSTELLVAWSRRGFPSKSHNRILKIHSLQENQSSRNAHPS